METANRGDDDSELDALERMMARLQQLTANVAADVGEHNSKVQEINTELTEATADGSKVLLVVEKLVKANQTMQSQLAQAESRLNEQSREIETHFQEARTDALTKLWNRRYFDDELTQCHEALKNSGRPACVMMLDIDHFKRINDTYGHQAGDEVLKGVARTLHRVVGNNIVCRYGGEEFAIIFPGLNIKQAMPIAEKARATIAEQVVEFDGLDLKVTASGGLAQLDNDGPPREALRRSDEALYASKSGGRNRGYWHDGQICLPMAGQLETIAASSETSDRDHEVSSGQLGERIVGVSDRISFQHDVQRRIADWNNGGATLSVLLVEIDFYETLQRTRGNKAREVIVRAAAQFLKAAMREMDHIARYNETVFSLLLPGTDLTETTSVAERLRSAIARCSLPIDGTKVKFTVSLGAAEVTENDTDETLLARADLSLAAAKESGGNCSFVATATGDLRSMAVIA